MKDIAIFLAGVLVKSIVGYFVGAGIRRSEKAAEPFVKKVLVNERAEFLRSHVLEEHKEPIKSCRTNQCVSLA